MRRTYLIGGVACVGVVCITRLLLDPYPATTQPHSYSEAVMQALDQRAIAYTDVRVGGLCQPQAQCWESRYGAWYNSAWVYVAEVVVEAAQPVYGRIECKCAGEDCVLVFDGAQAHPIPLPSLPSESPWLWVIKQRAEAIATQLRAWIQRVQQP